MGDEPRGDLHDVHGWGVDVTGDLYLLDEVGRVVLAATPAKTQGRAERCAQELSEFPNAVGACSRADRRGWLDRSGAVGDCWHESDTIPITVTVMSPAEQRRDCWRTVVPRGIQPTFGPDLVHSATSDDTIPLLGPLPK